MVPLGGLELDLQHLELSGVTGWDGLGAQAAREWITHVAHTQVSGAARGVCVEGGVGRGGGVRRPGRGVRMDHARGAHAGAEGGEAWGLWGRAWEVRPGWGAQASRLAARGAPGRLWRLRAPLSFGPGRTHLAPCSFLDRRASSFLPGPGALS